MVNEYWHDLNSADGKQILVDLVVSGRNYDSDEENSVMVGMVFKGSKRNGQHGN